MNQSAPAVATFYQFVALADPAALCETLTASAATQDLKGTLLIAAEGINGTLTGKLRNLESFLAELRSQPCFADLAVKYSSAHADNPVFHRLKVRLKPEIVAMGVPGVAPQQHTGEHVSAQRWNQLLQDPSIPVIDVRNTYETRVGKFVGAVDPQTQSFREFPEYVAKNLDPQQQPRVAMYCTGGIRCEKASAYLLEQGFAEVYQLDGGILNYLAQVNAEDNQFAGECFVFDQRVSVNAALDQGEYVQCFACRSALTEDDTKSEHYVQGLSCPYCYADLTPQQQASFAERQKQIELAEQRGIAHIGAQYPGPDNR